MQSALTNANYEAARFITQSSCKLENYDQC